MPTATATSGAGARQEALEPEDQPEHGERQHQGGDGCLRHVLEDRQQVPEESGLLDMDAQQLRDLIDDDDQADAGFEAGQHGLGDEVGDEAEPQRSRERRNRPDQHRQRGPPPRAAPPVRHRAPRVPARPRRGWRSWSWC
jgi:hypothetical protein